MHPSEIYVGMLRTLDPHALHGLELSYFKSFDVLKHAVAVFLPLMWLRISRAGLHVRQEWCDEAASALGSFLRATTNMLFVSSFETNVDDSIGEWGELLYLLPEVEVLHGVSPFKDPSGTSVADNDDRAGELAMICPKVYRTKH